jgi:hypothetical protein
MIDKIIKLFKKPKPTCENHIYLREKHMKRHFPEFQKIDDGWELEFSPGNSLTILFDDCDNALLYVSKGDSESGYSTMLYSENASHSTVRFCINKYSTPGYKMSLERSKKIENLGI